VEEIARRFQESVGSLSPSDPDAQEASEPRRRI